MLALRAFDSGHSSRLRWRIEEPIRPGLVFWLSKPEPNCLSLTPCLLVEGDCGFRDRLGEPIHTVIGNRGNRLNQDRLGLTSTFHFDIPRAAFSISRATGSGFDTITTCEASLIATVSRA